MMTLRNIPEWNHLMKLYTEKAITMNLREVYEKHYLPVLCENAAVRTIKSYEETIIVWEKWEKAFGNINISEIQKIHIDNFKKYLSRCRGIKKETFMRPNTIRKHLRTIKPILAAAVKAKIIESVPKINMPKETYRNASDALTLNEIAAWISVAKKDTSVISGIPAGIWWENLLTFIYNTGIRIGSALQIRWSWIDFETQTLILQKEIGIKTLYEIYLNDEAINSLKKIRNVSQNTQPEDRVFKWSMNRRTLYSKAKKQQTLAGIPKERQFKFHGIRKYFGSEIARKKPAAATKALGHSDNKVTINYYMNRRQVSDPFVNAIAPIGNTIDSQEKTPLIQPSITLLHHYTACNTEVIVIW
jgi:integrase